MAEQKELAWTAKILIRLRPFGVAGLLIPCFIGIAFLAADVWRELVELDRLSFDNTQWAVMQTEVEVLRLELSVETAIQQGINADLSDLRRWFDVIYSRIQMLAESEAYAPKFFLPDFAPDAKHLQAFLDRTVPLIDGPDSELRAALASLAESLPEVRLGARRLTLNARSDSAVASDARRQAVKSTLVYLVSLTAFLIIALSGLALILLQLIRGGREQMRQNSLTSARLQTIFSTSADAIIVTNRGGWIVDFNPAAESMFGYARKQVLGVHALDLLLPPDLATAQSNEIFATLEVAGARANEAEQGPLRIELLGMRSDNVRIPVEMSLGTMQVASGGVIVALVRDISDRRLAQTTLTDALQLAQAGEKTKADFIAVMSHEMRTPLNGLLGSLELLGATNLHAGQKDLVNVMASSGQILLQHVNSVLDIWKAEADRAPTLQTAFDLDRLIEDCVANQSGLATKKGLALSVEPVDGPIGWVRGDPTRVRQILLNLVGNAVKFTAQGRISIEVERLGRDLPVEIRVIDTGVGIAEDDQERVFDDFITLDARYDRQAGGTGLGLGIARRVARAIGAEIGVESVLGSGSLFWVRIPLPPAAAVAPDPKVEPAKTSLRVLLIEDNPVNRFVLRRLLEESGHLVQEAAKGAEGVATAMSNVFDLIMTDISMPGLDGVEVARQIRGQSGPSQHARIVAVTAHALDADLARFRAAGMDDCLTKPITRVSLAATLSGSPAWTMPQQSVQILDRTQISDLEQRLGSTATAALLIRAIAEGDAAEADKVWLAGDTGSQRLHALAGTAGTFGALSLQTRLAALLDARTTGDSAEIARLSGTLVQVWQNTKAALQNEASRLQTYPSPAEAGA